ncbi:GntR family transcriptional regulator [Zophobihabitans entericus]|uniref:GntR family transcriptional regulator n=1 Tax=Zophobihabitans entericus TaxID=1635327 RepID=A0A6G9IA76_9GAMM|nr:GntR family transcriptional regulator [Zophobihabitans entericus]QIQ20732.1 GntR family transcriptional regulator [Zophobihabitans entericus]
MNNLKKLIQASPFVSGSPLYLQLARLLEDGIRNKVFSSGFLPPEREIAKALSISRVTVCKSLEVLAKKKLIERQQGVGTRIIFHIDYSLTHTQGFTAQIGSQGDVASTRWLVREKHKIDERMAEYIHLPVGTLVAYLKRVRLVNGSPTSLESTHIPLKYLPEPELLEGSLYKSWEDKGFLVKKKSYRLRAIACDEELASLLNVSLGTPIMKTIDTSWSNFDEIMEVSETFVLGEYYEYKFETQ